MKRIFQILFWIVLVVGIGRMFLMSYEDEDIIEGIFLGLFVLPHSIFFLLAVSGFTDYAKKVPLIWNFFRKETERIYDLCFSNFPTLYRPEVGGRKAKNPIIYSTVAAVVFFPGEILLGRYWCWQFSLLQVCSVIIFICISFAVREYRIKLRRIKGVI